MVIILIYIYIKLMIHENTKIKKVTKRIKIHVKKENIYNIYIHIYKL
jgi:hypothetical protein